MKLRNYISTIDTIELSLLIVLIGVCVLLPHTIIYAVSNLTFLLLYALFRYTVIDNESIRKEIKYVYNSFLCLFLIGYLSNIEAEYIIGSKTWLFIVVVNLLTIITLFTLFSSYCISPIKNTYSVTNNIKSIISYFRTWIIVVIVGLLSLIGYIMFSDSYILSKWHITYSMHIIAWCIISWVVIFLLTNRMSVITLLSEIEYSTDKLWKQLKEKKYVSILIIVSVILGVFLNILLLHSCGIKKSTFIWFGLMLLTVIMFVCSRRSTYIKADTNTKVSEDRKFNSIFSLKYLLLVWFVLSIYFIYMATILSSTINN